VVEPPYGEESPRTKTGCTRKRTVRDMRKMEAIRALLRGYGSRIPRVWPDFRVMTFTVDEAAPFLQQLRFD